MANYLHTRPYSKSLGFAGHMVCCKHSILSFDGIHRQYVNERVCTNKTLFTDSEISYDIHVLCNILLPLIYFKSFKNVKTVLNSTVIQKQRMDWICPMGYSFLTFPQNITDAFPTCSWTCTFTICLVTMHFSFISYR